MSLDLILIGVWIGHTLLPPLMPLPSPAQGAVDQQVPFMELLCELLNFACDTFQGLQRGVVMLKGSGLELMCSCATL